ncbi:hypothetical protein GGR51DRAFT_539130 [Nemania sp. FL0031]|nr:hypothetical protein GGR51DRAFT_539130 [Nemania sp. FL0031]
MSATGRSPVSWVYHIVSEIAGQHRLLAVVGRKGSGLAGDEGPHGRDIVASVQAVLSILSDAANYVAIESERALAVDYFHENPPHEDPDVDSMPSGFDYSPFQPAASKRIMEFPFISTCLFLGASDGTLPQGIQYIGDVVVAPPRPVFGDERPPILGSEDCGHGMVVFDITKLKSPRYGIVIFRNRAMVQWDLWGDDPEDVEEKPSREPLSAAAYLEKYGYEDPRGMALRLGTIPLIDPVAINPIWPDPKDLEDPRFLPRAPLQPPCRSLRDQTIVTLINSTHQIEHFEMSIFDGPRQIPDFQDLLRRMLYERPDRLAKTRSAGQLISLAFIRSQHLDLVRFKGLSAEAIAGMLETEELRSVVSISLCLDTLSSPPAQIIDVLASAESLPDIYFFQKPTRRNDQLSTDIFVELSKQPQMFNRGRIFISGAYSAALRGRFWLPMADYPHPPFAVFPVRHILCREQINDCRLENGDPMFHHLTPYYIGDSLFRAEAFVDGFLHWVLKPDYKLRALAAGPTAHKDMSRFGISPIPPIIYGEAKVSVFPGDWDRLWPEMRDLLPDSWSVLVSMETHINHEAEAEYERINGSPRSYRAQIWKYAFVRQRKCIPIVGVGGQTAVPVTLGPEDVDVFDVKDFLQITAPHVDSAIVSQRLEVLEDKMSRSRGLGILGSGMRWLSVLEHQEAYTFLKDFIMIGREAKKTLPPTASNYAPLP